MGEIILFPATYVLRCLATLRVRHPRRALFCFLLLALTTGLTSLLLMAASSEGQSWTATWTQRANPLAAPRGGVGAAFNAATGRPVLFGGGPAESQNDVWQYDAGTDTLVPLESHE